MLDGKRPEEAKLELEEILNNSGKTYDKIAFLNVDIDHSDEYYDAFGPEQEKIAASTLLGAIKSRQDLLLEFNNNDTPVERKEEIANIWFGIENILEDYEMKKHRILAAYNIDQLTRIKIK